MSFPESFLESFGGSAMQGLVLPARVYAQMNARPATARTVTARSGASGYD